MPGTRNTCRKWLAADQTVEVFRNSKLIAGCRVPHVPLFGAWVLGSSDPALNFSPKTKTPEACVRGLHLELVAGVRFELTTFGL